jgi:hypothetical protein
MKNLLRLASFGFVFLSASSAMHAASVDLKATVAKIDKLVADDLAKNKMEANPPASDEIFVRRLYLDVVGRIPTLKETNDFLSDTAKDKRAKLIDALIASDAYTDNFYNYWSDILRMKSTLTVGNSQPAGAAYGNWLRESLKTNKPYDQMVRELVTADGKTYENGAVGFYIRDYNMPLDNMAVTTKIFLGTSMVCAQCHNHPFDKWTQMDYYQLAAHSYGMTSTNGLTNPLLAKAIYGDRSSYGKKAKKAGKPVTPKGSVAKTANAIVDANAASGPKVPELNLPEGMKKSDVTRAVSEILRPLRYNTVLDESHTKALKLPHDYKYEDAKPNQVIEATIPASFSKDGKIVKKDQHPIDAYGQWMTSKENPRFTTVIANRLWRKVMGIGLIEPVDEITDSTVPSNPQLMTFLEDTMKSLNYDMKAFLRIVLNSSTYQRAAFTKDVELGEAYHFQGPILRRMSAEQIWDSIVTLYKPSPDQPSIAAKIEHDSSLRRIEWLDRALNNLSPKEMQDCAIKVAKKQKDLAEEVHQAQISLTEANKNKDEDAIRKAKKSVASQRKRLDEAVEEIVFDTGFKKFAELARDGKLDQFSKDPEFAKEVETAIKAQKGKELHIDDALAILARQQRAKYDSVQKQRRVNDAQKFNVKLSGEGKGGESLKSWEQLRDTTFVRACDLRSPAPNGHFLREFGQSDRELVDNFSTDARVSQALMLLNGKVFSQLMNPYSVIARSLASAKQKGSDAVIHTVYRALLSRDATEEELKVLRPVADNADTTDRGDVLWTVLNTRQFFFIQ